jgi:hypothetical protein
MTAYKEKTGYIVYLDSARLQERRELAAYDQGLPKEIGEVAFQLLEQMTAPNVKELNYDIRYPNTPRPILTGEFLVEEDDLL